MPYNYYDNKDFVSNSDLNEVRASLTSAFDHLANSNGHYYVHGDIFDAMLTERGRLPKLKGTVPEGEWAMLENMVASFKNDRFCMRMLSISRTQYEFYRKRFRIEYQGEEFFLPVKCKFDLYTKHGISGDIKTGVFNSQKQFDEAIDYFNWDQQRAWYMDIGKTDKDILMGVSKIWPYRVFMKAISRGDALYQSGKNKYSYWAYKYYTLVWQFNEVA